MRYILLVAFILLFLAVSLVVSKSHVKNNFKTKQKFLASLHLIAFTSSAWRLRQLLFWQNWFWRLLPRLFVWQWKTLDVAIYSIPYVSEIFVLAGSFIYWRTSIWNWTQSNICKGDVDSSEVISLCVFWTFILNKIIFRKGKVLTPIRQLYHIREYRVAQFRRIEVVRKQYYTLK